MRLSPSRLARTATTPAGGWTPTARTTRWPAPASAIAAPTPTTLEAGHLHGASALGGRGRHTMRRLPRTDPPQRGNRNTHAALNVPAAVVHAVLNDLAEGRSYTHASMRALERMDRPASAHEAFAASRSTSSTSPESPDRTVTWVPTGTSPPTSSSASPRWSPSPRSTPSGPRRPPTAKGLAGRVRRRRGSGQAQLHTVGFHLAGRVERPGHRPDEWVTDSKDELVGRSSKLVRVRACRASPRTRGRWSSPSSKHPTSSSPTALPRSRRLLAPPGASAPPSSRARGTPRRTSAGA